ncbi:DNA ligase 1 isoform X2 [Takifugu flavidus]|uniref:DNA ligase 1 isoform X2 n=1 Tax=Takifugu flavidus TaxID=433684 RepID=UPI002544CF8C|nr:DNA ligase 1 isoform X2 [Takifugu flavidus]
MQRSIASFFQPRNKDKKATEEPTKKATKSPLKVQNRVPEADSPIKKVAKRGRHVLDSDDDDVPAVKEEVTKQADKEVKREKKDGALKADSTPLSPATPASSASPGTPRTPNSLSPSGIVKRKTARKTFPKRKLDGSRSGSESPKEEEEEAKEQEEVQRHKRPRVESGLGGGETPSVPMEEGEQEEQVETAKIQATSPDQEEKEQAESKISDETDLEAEAAKKNERTRKKHDEKRPASAKERDTKEEVLKGGMDKEPSKKAPVSSFFAPRKAAVKMEKAETHEGEKKTSAELKPSADEDKDAKRGTVSGRPDYNPARPNYHPVDHASWTRDQKVPYLAVARTFEKIEEDSGRLRNIETLSNLFRSVLLLSPDDLLSCVYLCLNQLGPAYQGMELGVGETVLMKAVAQATGRQLDKIKAEAQERGDLGLVAESSRSNQRMMFQPASLTVGGVFRKLKEIASMTGNSAMNKKIDIIKGLFVACRFSEARYIVRSLAGKLRIGLAEQSVLAALSQAVCLTPPGQGFPPAVLDAGKGMSPESRRSWMEEKSLILKQTYCEMPNYDVLIPVLLKEGIDQLPNHCKLTPGVPLRPMLAHPTKGVGEVMKKFDEAVFTCEYKYDGERAQIHILETGEVRIFSRNQEDNTSKYPDIVSRVAKVKKDFVVSCVLDSEAVAWDHEKQQIQPFQVLTTRKRKDVDASEIRVQVCVYAFDLLYLNGETPVRA